MDIKKLDEKYLISSSEIYTKIDSKEFMPTSEMKLPSKLECLVGYEKFVDSMFEALSSNREDDNIVIYSRPGHQVFDFVKMACQEYITNTTTENVDQLAAYNINEPKEPIVFLMQAGKGRQIVNDLKYTLDNIQNKVNGFYKHQNHIKKRNLVKLNELQEKKEKVKNSEEKNEIEKQSLKLLLEIEGENIEETSLIKQLHENYEQDKDKRVKEVVKQVNSKLNKKGYTLEKHELIQGYCLKKDGKTIYKPDDVTPEEFWPKEYLDFQDWRFSFFPRLNLTELNLPEKQIIRKEFNNLRFLYMDENGVLDVLNSYETFLFENVAKLKPSSSPFLQQDLMAITKGNKFPECTLHLLQDNFGFENKVRFDEGDAKNLIKILGSIDPFTFGKKDHQRINPGKLVKVSGGPQGKRGILLLKDLDSALDNPKLGKYLSEVLLNDKAKPIDSKGDLNHDPILAKARVVAVLEEEKYSRFKFEHVLNGKLAQVFKREISLPTSVENNLENRVKIAKFLKSNIVENNYLDATPGAISSLIEKHLVGGSKDKLSLKLDNLVDLYARAEFIASKEGEGMVTEDYVNQAFEKKILEINQMQDLMSDFDAKNYFPQKKMSGVIGGMSILAYKNKVGTPFRIAVSAIKNKKKGLRFFNLEKTADLAGKSSVKGFIQVEQLLQRLYQDALINYDLLLSHSGKYNPHDGPSASTATSVACISALSNIPIYPNTFFTGAIDPIDGQSLRIGGLNEKIAGVINLTLNKNLEDVVVGFPKANLDILQLAIEKYRHVVNSKKVRLYAYENMDEALEIATRTDPKTIHDKIMKKTKNKKGFLSKLLNNDKK